MRTLPVKGRSVAVRHWTPEDDPVVAALSQEAFAEYGARPASYTVRMTHRPSTKTWLAMEGTAPVGLVLLEQTGRAWSIVAVAVTARARARGIGGLLMAVAERHAAARGARQLQLFTADANLAALDLFLRRGFRIVGRRRGFYSRGQDACLLSKKLAA